jgi:hypothetical protein
MRFFTLILRTLACSTALAGCGGGESQFAPGVSLKPPSSDAEHASVTQPCRAFSAVFDEQVACERADGTLKSFTDPKITWRVRFFVRYWRMPCGEAPTVKEGYVFHMVTNDLYNDLDLDDPQRLAIRDAMFNGKVRCS